MPRLDRVATIVLFGVLTSCAFYLLLRAEALTKVFFWDYQVYAGAIEAFGKGMNGYERGVIQQFGVGSAFNFTSPPFFLALLQALDGLLGQQALFAAYATVFAALLAISTLAQLRLLAPHAPLRALDGDALAILAGFNIAGLMTIISGNFGVILNAIVAIGIGHGVRSRQWWPLFLGIAFCAAIKPFYLQFLIVPVFLEPPTVRRLLAAAASAGAAAAAYAASWLGDPARFEAWRASLVDQSLTRGDVGANVFAFVVNDLAPGNAVLVGGAVQVLFTGCLLLLVLVGMPRNNERRLAGLWVAACFANPRMMMYDLAFVTAPVVALTAAWGARRLAISRHAAGAFCCAALFGLGLFSTTDPVVPRSLSFPLMAVLAIAAGCLDERRGAPARAGEDAQAQPA